MSLVVPAGGVQILFVMSVVPTAALHGRNTPVVSDVVSFDKNSPLPSHVPDTGNLSASDWSSKTVLYENEYHALTRRVLVVLTKRQCPPFSQHGVRPHPQTANLRPVVHSFLPDSLSFGTG